MRVLIDMNLSPRWVGALNDARLEPAHWSKLGHYDAPDSAVMSLARERNCVVLTSELSVSAILAASEAGKPSVVRIRASDTSPDAIGARVIAALRQMADELAAGAVVTMDLDENRIRILPLSTDSHPVGGESY